MKFSSLNRIEGKLYIVSTPIGNREDITLRALRILKEVDLIAAEDTRHTSSLLKHFGIQTPLTSYFEGNELKKKEFLLSKLRQGNQIALVSDAGTPGISDPGFRLIQAAESLSDILDVLGDREMVLTRELTKIYEEVLRGKVSEIINQIGERKLKGEVTLVISGKIRKKPSLSTPEVARKYYQHSKDF